MFSVHKLSIDLVLICYTLTLVTEMVLAASETEIKENQVEGIDVGECVFKSHKSWTKSEREKLWQMSSLFGQSFSTSDDDLPHEAGDTKYSYEVGVCAVPQKVDFEATQAGAVQFKTDRTESEDPHTVPVVIGRLNNTHFMHGTDWVLLEYRDGEAYGNHCNKEMRRTVLMIVCSPYQTRGVLRILEENNNKEDSCFYLFELEHNSVCSVHSGLSIGSIVCIVFFSLVAVYLIGGFFYKRFIAGAKGIEQIPNLHFWRDFGNLQADGCDLLCRCGYQKPTRSYRGVGDDQLTTEQEREPLQDDSLLPM